MKRFILAAAALGGLVMLQSPAHAQYPYNPPYDQGPYNHPPYDPDRYEHHGEDEGNAWDIDQRITWLEDRIARGEESGELDRGAIWRAQQQIQSVRRDEERDRYRNRGRLTEYQRESLINRVEAIGRTLRWREDYREPWEYR